MNTATLVTTYAAIGLTVVVALLGLGWYLTLIAGRLLWKRLVRVYHLTVILYWLDRIEKVGWRTFQKAEREDITNTQGGAR